jgi:hypothetical protein
MVSLPCFVTYFGKAIRLDADLDVSLSVSTYCFSLVTTSAYV